MERELELEQALGVDKKRWGGDMEDRSPTKTSRQRARNTHPDVVEDMIYVTLAPVVCQDIDTRTVEDTPGHNVGATSQLLD